MMDFVQVQERWNIDRARSWVAAWLVKSSYVSLGLMIVLIPLRYRWVLQTHLSPPIYEDYTNLLLFPTDIFLTLAVLLWLISMFLKPRRISLDPILLTVPLILLVIISAASILFSVDPLVSAYNAVKIFLLFCLYLYLVNETHNLTQFILPLGLMVIIQSIVGITQVLTQHSLGIASLQELALDPAWQGVSIVWSHGVRSLRAYGLSDHPNILGGCLAFSLILLAAIYMEIKPVWRPWLAVLFSVGALALLLTFSRAAWLGFFAGLLLILVWATIAPRKEGISLLSGLCFGAFLLAIPFLWSNASLLGSRLNSDGSFSQATPENQSIQERSMLNRQAYKILSQDPLTGIGVGAFPQAFRRMNPQYPFNYQPPHNVLLEVAAETGYPGAFAYLLVLLAPWVLLFRLRKNFSFSFQLVGASAALLAITIVSFLDYYPWLLNSGRTWQWLLWGLWGGIYSGIVKRKAYG